MTSTHTILKMILYVATTIALRTKIDTINHIHFRGSRSPHETTSPENRSCICGRKTGKGKRVV